MRLPMDKIARGIDAAGQDLGNDEDHARLFGGAILTTDKKRKAAAAEFKVGNRVVRIAGVCKGSGKIGPRMGNHAGAKEQLVGKCRAAKPKHATMLAYLTSDAQIAPAMLRKLMAQASEGSFNAVTVDDQTSTNDTACILASGASGAKIESAAAAQQLRGGGSMKSANRSLIRSPRMARGRRRSCASTCGTPRTKRRRGSSPGRSPIRRWLNVR